MATRKTSSRKTPTSPAKSTAPKSGPAREKPAVQPDTGTPVAAVETAEMTTAQVAEAPGAVRPALKKKDLFERVKARASGVKGHDVRVVLDAVLEELGALLVEGDSLNARPLGTLKVQKHRPITGADVVVCKLRRKKPEGGGKDPLAEAAE